MEEACPICLEIFSESSRPVTVCQNLHFICYSCSQKIEQIKCPYCRKNYNCQKFELYEECETLLEEVNFRPNVNALRGEFILTISELQGFLNHQQNILDLVNVAKNAMKTGDFDLAISVLTNLIRQNFDYAESEDYLGLGPLEKKCGTHSQNDCEWFWNKYGYNLSIYDQLGLCLMFGLTVKEQRKCFKGLLKENNGSKMLYGLAALQHSTGNYKKALRLYNKITCSCSGFSKPYEMLATIYSQLNNRKKAAQYARKCLKINPLSIYVKLLLDFNSISFGFKFGRDKFIKIVKQQLASYQYYNFMSFLLPWAYRQSHEIYLDSYRQADLRKKCYQYLQHRQIQQISVICDRLASQAKIYYEKSCLFQQIYQSQSLKKYEFEWKYYFFAKIPLCDFRDIAKIEVVNSFICQPIKPPSKYRPSDVSLRIVDKLQGQIVFKQISKAAEYAKDILKRCAMEVVKTSMMEKSYFVVVIRVFTIYY